MWHLWFQHMSRDLDLDDEAHCVIAQESKRILNESNEWFVPLWAMFFLPWALLVLYVEFEILRIQPTSSVLLLHLPVQIPPILLCLYCRRRLRCRATYRVLREMGYSTCPKCRYWLMGLPEPLARCPECGAEQNREPPRRSTAIFRGLASIAKRARDQIAVYLKLGFSMSGKYAARGGAKRKNL